jgi:hypothetical protein
VETPPPLLYRNPVLRRSSSFEPHILKLAGHRCSISISTEHALKKPRCRRTVQTLSAYVTDVSAQLTLGPQWQSALKRRTAGAVSFFRSKSLEILH